MTVSTFPTRTGVFVFDVPLVTGQTVDYSVAGRTAKDDGNLGLGQPRQFTVLTTGRYNGNTNITVGAAAGIVTNNCVIDEVTGLMWCREVHPAAVVWDDTGGSDEDAFALVDEANAQALAGYADWRLPNLSDLLSLWDAGNVAPCLDVTSFPSWLPAWLWSSTTDPNVTVNALRVYFNFPSVDSAAKITAPNTFTPFVRQ